MTSPLSSPILGSISAAFLSLVYVPPRDESSGEERSIIPYHLGDYHKAKIHLHKALNTKYKLVTKSSYKTLGTVFQFTVEYDKAKEYIVKALLIRIQIGDKEGEAILYGT